MFKKCLVVQRYISSIHVSATLIYDACGIAWSIEIIELDVAVSQIASRMFSMSLNVVHGLRKLG